MKIIMEEKYNYKTVELIKEWVENDGRIFRIPSPSVIFDNQLKEKEHWSLIPIRIDDQNEPNDKNVLFKFLKTELEAREKQWKTYFKTIGVVWHPMKKFELIGIS